MIKGNHHMIHLKTGDNKFKCGTEKLHRHSFIRGSDDIADVTCKRCLGTVKRHATPELEKDLTGCLLHSSWGYDMTHNEFYKIVRQTKKSVFAVKVGSDGYEGYSGSERPNKDKVLEGGKEYCFKVSHTYGDDNYIFVNRKVYGNSFSLDNWDNDFYYNTLD